MNIPSHDEIAEFAYALWEQEGHPSDRSVEHWLIAEQELNLRRTPVIEGNSIGITEKAPRSLVKKQKGKAETRSRLSDLQ